jgi:glycosyltransferase involved in cell wall biosynthesis
MRLAFVDFVAWDYTVDSVYQRALAEPQTAFCHLAAELAARGHDVHLVNNTAQPAFARGVHCLPLGRAHGDFWNTLDGVVLLDAAKQALAIRPLLGPECRLVLWTLQTSDSPAMQPLEQSEVREALNAIVFASQWQRTTFERILPADFDRSRVIHSAISPAMRDLFAPGESIVAHKRPPALVYNGAPDRGLDILAHVFADIRKKIPGTELLVYSSVPGDQISAEKEAARFGNLYQLCRGAPGIRYAGALPPAKLAPKLREAAILAYPNHKAETSGITVLEAMAAGCRVVSSQLGALEEITDGFARLIPVGDDWLTFAEAFVDETVRMLEEWQEQPQEMDRMLADQVARVNAESIWPRRAAEWEELFASIAANNSV